MINEHKEYIPALEKYLVPIGFTQSENTDFSVTYKNAAGWRICVCSEKYYEGIFRWLYSPNESTPYSIFVLIRVFEEQFGRKISLNSRYSWLAFIAENHHWLMSSSQSYKERYDELNKSFL